VNELIPLIGGGAGLFAVIAGAVLAVVNRRKISAEAAHTMNTAAQIADEAVTQRMKNLKDELWDALDVSEQRGRVITKMDHAIWTMRIRIERHANWDVEIKDLVNELIALLTEHSIAVSAHVHDPPPLDFSDLDMDFTIYPPRSR